MATKARSKKTSTSKTSTNDKPEPVTKAEIHASTRPPNIVLDEIQYLLNNPEAAGKLTLSEAMRIARLADARIVIQTDPPTPLLNVGTPAPFSAPPGAVQRTHGNGRPTVYISGPISTDHPGLNRDLFEKAETDLWSNGWNVINPFKLGEIENGQWKQYLARNLPYLLAADAIALIPGWEKSQRSRLEVHIANELGIIGMLWKLMLLTTPEELITAKVHS